MSFVGPAVHLTIETGVGHVRCIAPGRANRAETASRFHWDADDVWLVAP